MLSSTPEHLIHSEPRPSAGVSQRSRSALSARLREPVDQAMVWSYVERGLALAGDGDSEARARLLLVRAFWGWGASVRRIRHRRITRSSEERAGDAAEAVDIAARLGLADVESAALDAVGGVAWDERRYHRVPKPSTAGCCLSRTCVIRWSSGDALAMAARIASRWVPTRRRWPWHRASYEEVDAKDWLPVLHAMAWRAKARLILGEWDEALNDLAAATAILRTGELDEPPPFSWPVWTLGAFICAARGRVDDADRLLAMISTQVAEGALPRHSSGLVLAQVRRGRLEEARRSFKSLE